MLPNLSARDAETSPRQNRPGPSRLRGRLRRRAKLMLPFVLVVGTVLFAIGAATSEHLRPFVRRVLRSPHDESGTELTSAQEGNEAAGEQAMARARAKAYLGCTSLTALIVGFLIIVAGIFPFDAFDAHRVSELRFEIGRSSAPSPRPPSAYLRPQSPPAPPPPPPAPYPPGLGPVPLIIDTDMSFDVDDVGAVCVAHALADRGAAEIIGIVYDSGYPYGVGAIDALNHYYGRPHIPLGSYKGPFGQTVSGVYALDLALNFPAVHRNYSSVPDASTAYRGMLSRAADNSVVIAAIGFLTALRELLMSEPDSISPLNGVDLVALKVRKVVFQGGWYHPLHPNGHTTFNWDCGGGESLCCGYTPNGCNASAQYVLDHMPETVQMIFSDVGDEIYHGGALTSCAPITSPCRQAFLDFHGPLAYRGRNSWDPVVVVAAVLGPEAMNTTEADVGWRNTADERGANFWTPGTDARQSHLVLVGNASDGWRHARADASAALDELLCSPPALGALGGGGTT